MHEAEYVLHLAARTSVPRSVKDPSRRTRSTSTDAERFGRRKRAEGQARGLRGFVLGLRGDAYSAKVETMQPEPISPYGVTKYVGELYGQTFGRCYGLENVALRYFNIFGPRQDPVRLIPGCLPNFVRHFRKTHSPWFRGRRADARLHLRRQCVQANLLACEAPNASGKVFNVGVGGRVSLIRSSES